MLLYKLISYYGLSYMIYKFIKKNILCINTTNDIYHNNNIDNITDNDNTTHIHNISTNSLIHTNIINNIHLDEKLILYDSFNNYTLDEYNYITFEFNTKINYNYKININIINDNIKNVKIFITDKYKDYSYIQYIENITDFTFILDNNIFNINNINNINNNQTIYIKLYFYFDQDYYTNDTVKNIRYVNINVIEKNILLSNSAIIIYKLNNDIFPIITNVKNILDTTDYTNFEYNII